jgi:hypothetical protein
MHQHIKQLWVDALRSGNYQQGTRRLRSENAYCCLGVLCDLYDRDQGGPGWDEEDQTYLDVELLLPREVAEWAGLIPVAQPETIIPGWFADVDLPQEDYSLSNLNDNGSSFGEIADLIEQQL